MSWKVDLPTEESLQNHIERSWGDFTSEVINEVGPAEKEYRKVVRMKKIGTYSIFLVVISVFALDVFGSFNLDRYIGPDSAGFFILTFVILAIGFEKNVGFLNIILSFIAITEFIFLS